MKKSNRPPKSKRLQNQKLNSQVDRLQKLLANEGIGSRREIETWIEEGRIKVNGKVAKLGDKASLMDRIVIDDKRIIKPRTSAPIAHSIVYHKSIGEVCTRTDPEKRKTVFDNLPRCKSGRWIMIGRLDINTSGLLLFTNNGEIANYYMHPRNEVEREYAVRIDGLLSSTRIAQLIEGIELEDGLAKFHKVVYQGGEGRNHWYHVTLSEGRNREVRRLFEALDYQVSRLMRIRYGDITLPRSISPGKFESIDLQLPKSSKGAKADDTIAPDTQHSGRASRSSKLYKRK